MRLAVIGSRGLSVSVEMVLAELQAVKVDIDSIDTVISGGAVGVDSVADELADRVGAAVRIHVPDYDRHGHRAPFIRNKDIVKQADFVFSRFQHCIQDNWIVYKQTLLFNQHSF